MSEEDARFIDQLAAAEATTSSGAMRKLVRWARTLQHSQQSEA
jgi:hypothetical protein